MGPVSGIWEARHIRHDGCATASRLQQLRTFAKTIGQWVGAAMPDVGSNYRVQLLGGFGITQAGHSLPLGPSNARIVALLACRARPLSRHLAAGLLWPDCPDSRATANLRSAVYRMSSSHPGLIISSLRQVVLDPAAGVDFHVAIAAAQRVLAGSKEEFPPCVREALTQDLLPCWHEDAWVVEEREAFRQRRLHALETLCLAFAKRGRYGEAVDAALAVVQAEPLRESAHRALVMVHLQEGNYSEALRQYQRCRALLRDELGIDPSPRLHDLIFAPHQARRACNAAITSPVPSSQPGD